MKNSIRMAVSCAAAAFWGCSAQAQDSHDAWVRVGARAFGNYEKDVYGMFEVGKTLEHGFSLQVDGTLSPFRTIGSSSGGSVRFGGSDVELLGTYKLESGSVPLELSLGVDQPRTPARTNAALSYRAKAYLPGAKDLTWWANAYGVAGTDSIAMLGAGARYELGSGVALTASGAIAIQGNNSVNPSRGATNRLGVYSFGLSIPAGSGRNEAWLDVTLTNQVGWTTGMSATPALGGFPGVGLSYKVRF